MYASSSAYAQRSRSASHAAASTATNNTAHAEPTSPAKWTTLAAPAGTHHARSETLRATSKPAAYHPKTDAGAAHHASVKPCGTTKQHKHKSTPRLMYKVPRRRHTQKLP